LNPFYLVLLHTYTHAVFDGGRQEELGHICDLPSFHALPAVRLPSRFGQAPLDSTGSLSWQVRLKPGQRVRASYALQQQHVHRQAQPADASRGVELGAVSVRVLLESGGWQTVTAQPSRILLPTAFPDQTMSSNVLTLVSTVLALLTGQVMNIVALPKR